MIALTLSIPDWIFCGPFWLGFVVGLGSFIALTWLAMNSFKPFR